VAELRAKARQLEEANRHKNQFLANVSHELKTPLNAILGFADILESELHGPVTTRQREYLRRMAQAGQHLLAMISDLIDVAKMDLGALALTDQEFAPGDLLREVGELLAPQVAAKRHRLTLTAPPDLPPMYSDRHRVQQILVNLLANAIKFTPEGGELELGVAAAEPGWLCWSVRDNGIGIAPADQEAIFEDFVQLDSQLHRQHEGTGIGLALCRRLARLLGGEVAVASAPGAGSTFTVRLPLHRPPAA
jgi:signal transduction histidine kinase